MSKKIFENIRIIKKEHDTVKISFLKAIRKIQFKKKLASFPDITMLISFFNLSDQTLNKKPHNNKKVRHKLTRYVSTYLICFLDQEVY